MYRVASQLVRGKAEEELRVVRRVTSVLQVGVDQQYKVTCGSCWNLVVVVVVEAHSSVCKHDCGRN